MSRKSDGYLGSSLPPEEYVISAQKVRTLGLPMLEKLIAATRRTGSPGSAGGRIVAENVIVKVKIGDKAYGWDFGEVSSARCEDIARLVVNTIKAADGFGLVLPELEGDNE